MKHKTILSMIMVVLLLVGCGVEQPQVAPIPSNDSPIEPVVAPDTAGPKLNHPFIVDDALSQDAVITAYHNNQLETAQRMAQLYVDAIKIGLDLASDEGAIETYDLIFDRQTLVFTNLSPDEGSPDAYQCDLTGSGPNGERIVPLYILFQEESPRFYSPLSYYGKQSRNAVEIYLDYLSQGDAEKLSTWLSIDGGSSYLLEESSLLIQYYQQYDLSHVEIVNFDYDTDSKRFVYRVQDGKNQQFDIFMLYGDGFSMPDIYSVIDE